MGVEIIDQLTQKNNGKFPIVDSNNVKGGYYQVNTLEERNNIPMERRKEGMLCWVKNFSTYILSGGITNNNWQVFETSSGGSGSGSGNGSLVAETKEQISTLKGSVGVFIYVLNDEDNNNEPNIYIAKSVDSDGNISEVSPISSFSKSAVPTLSYDESMPEGSKIYKSTKDDVVLKFNFSSETYGDAKYKIYKNGSLIKTVSGSKGIVIINLGPITNEGTYELSVTATDYLGVPAPQTLVFSTIIGGLRLTSTFNETLSNTVFEI